MTGNPAAPNSDQLSDEELLRRVRPVDWENPRPKGTYDLAIVGAGPAGLTAAESAKQLGLSVALIEGNRLGGNSLNAGSVPSKILVHAAALRAVLREAEEFCVSSPDELRVDFAAVMARIRRMRTRIAEYHSVDRLRHAGIDIYFGKAQFTTPDALIVGDARLRFKKALIATGAYPRPPNIPGIEEVGYRTSANIFNATDLPKRLAIVGGGPLGCELAQAFCRLGSEVTIVQNDPKFLPREERDAAELLSWSMARDGVIIRLNTTVIGAHMDSGVKMLDTIDYQAKGVVPADEILVSIGRVPHVEKLCLERAGIAYDREDGVKVDDFLRTTNHDVYAAGDVCMSHKFTNVAEASARMAVHNAFKSEQSGRSHLTIPWCTFCDPEIAHVGLQVWEARERSIPVKTFTVMMQDVDRAIIDRQGDGFVKIHVKEGTDKILGATIVASRASEMINEMSVVMSAGIGMRDLADVLHIYPAQSEAIRMAAVAYKKDCAGHADHRRHSSPDGISSK
ncbi:MAG TPA: mercuric reductase [Stellaceae bacterium]|nr:mercuric reductase [Stellaceae bacterium]